MRHEAYMKTMEDENEQAGKMAYGGIDIVNNPPHYTKAGIQCIDAIKAALSPEEFRGFCKGNIIKYTWREKHKNGDEDISKCGWYAEELLTTKNQLEEE